MLMRAATVVQILQDLFYVLLHVLFYLWSLVNSHKYPQFGRQSNKNGLAIKRLFIVPLIVEPFDNSSLQFLVHFTELHVALDAVQLLLKLGSLSVHVRDHAANLTHTQDDTNYCTAIKSQNTVKPNPLCRLSVTSATSRCPSVLPQMLAQIPLRRLPQNFPSREVSGKSA